MYDRENILCQIMKDLEEEHPFLDEKIFKKTPLEQLITDIALTLNPNPSSEMYYELAETIESIEKELEPLMKSVGNDFKNYVEKVIKTDGKKYHSLVKKISEWLKEKDIVI